MDKTQLRKTKDWLDSLYDEIIRKDGFGRSPKDHGKLMMVEKVIEYIEPQLESESKAMRDSILDEEIQSWEIQEYKDNLRLSVMKVRIMALRNKVSLVNRKVFLEQLDDILISI